VDRPTSTVLNTLYRSPDLATSFIQKVLHGKLNLILVKRWALELKGLGEFEYAGVIKLVL